MIKMIKHANDETLYWEVWEDKRKLIIHYGIVGDLGETKEQKTFPFQNAEKLMNKLAKEKAAEGYDYLDDDELFELIIQYSYDDEDQFLTMLEKRHLVEDLMNECLGWTGNGFCDGGDIGSGTANIFNYVIDVEKATQTIIQELKKNNLLDEVKIAYYSPEEEDYIVLYPKGVDFSPI